MINHQHTSLSYVQLWLLNDVKTPSARGLENSKACNKYQVNFITGVYPGGLNKKLSHLIEF